MTGMNTGGPYARLIDGRFELLQRLGGGGMGLVWRARDTALDREVALKEVRPPDPAMAAADPAGQRELRERVLREARSLARLQHPNVVIIHHIVDSPEHPHPWLVMELVGGGSLADRLERGPLGVTEAARLGRGVLAALEAAHRAGIQHRDVKPGNVLLRTDGTPVLTDFGIAAMQGSTALTATGALIGSPEYIAPERIRGVEGDPSSDLWSLGMLLYVAVEGYHPLRRATTLATLAAVLDEPLPPPQRSGALGPVLAALLARDPAARPDGARLDQLLATVEYGAATDPAPAAWTPSYQDPRTPDPRYADPGYSDPRTPHPGTPDPRNPDPWGFDSQGSDSRGFDPRTPDPRGSGYPPPVDAAYGSSPYGTPADAPYDRPPVPHPVPAVPHPVDRTPGAIRRRRASVVSMSVVAVVVIAVIAWTLRPEISGAHAAGAKPPATAAGSSASVGVGVPTAAAATTAPSAPTNLLTPAGVRRTIAAIQPLLRNSRIIELDVYPGYASAEAPTLGDAKLYDDIDYRDGQVSRSPGGTVDSDTTTSDLRVFDWNVLPALLAKAQKTLNVPHPTSRYLIIGPDMFDGTPSIRVYLSDAYGSGYLEADNKGNLKRTYPRGS